MSKSKQDISPSMSAGNSVGHACPPGRRRFKGAGNPKGRPRGSKNKKTIVRQVALEEHLGVEKGKKVSRTTLELVLMRLRIMALEGKSAQSINEYDKWLDKCEPTEPKQTFGVLVAPAEMSEEEWIANVERENATKVRPE